MTMKQETIDCIDACTGCMQLCKECAIECERHDQPGSINRVSRERGLTVCHWRKLTTCITTIMTTDITLPPSIRGTVPSCQLRLNHPV